MELKSLVADGGAKSLHELLLALHNGPSLVELELGKAHLKLIVRGVKDQVEAGVVALNILKWCGCGQLYVHVVFYDL